MFDHEKLQVYGKAPDFAAKAAAWTSTWDKKYALVDHFVQGHRKHLVESSRSRQTTRHTRQITNRGLCNRFVFGMCRVLGCSAHQSAFGPPGLSSRETPALRD